ncbi:FMRFamide receptor-like [Tachypleus tridentatus]|uniref:FMRFamide receptor-like n=1 Tax=Tachypleus tridentatus TaxID=6853 RepID=UPI003FCFD88C
MEVNFSLDNCTNTSAATDSTEFIVSLCGAVFSIFGVIANVLCVVVLSQPRVRRAPVHLCLLVLTLFDTLVLILSLLLFCLPKLSTITALFHRYQWEVFPLLAPVLYPLALFAQTGSAWTTVAVTIERYVAICFPFKARTCTRATVRRWLAAVSVFSFGYNVPRFWELERRLTLDCSTNTTIYVVVTTNFGLNETYYQVYYVGLYSIVMYVLPFSLLFVLNGLIWRTVKRAKSTRRNTIFGGDKEKKLAVMLLCVVTVFFWCNVLAFLINLLEHVNYDISSLIPVSNMLVTLNSAVNFSIYVIFNKVFRKRFCVIFLKCLNPSSRSITINKKPMEFRFSHKYSIKLGSLYSTKTDVL